MKTIATKRFAKQLDGLLRKNRKYEVKVIKILSLIDFNLHHPSLRLHKLQNNETYSVSVDMKIRILLAIEGDKIWLLEIGNHDEVY